MKGAAKKSATFFASSVALDSRRRDRHIGAVGRCGRGHQCQRGQPDRLPSLVPLPQHALGVFDDRVRGERLAQETRHPEIFAFFSSPPSHSR